MLKAAIMIVLITPWFWHFHLPDNLLNLNISKDIETARQNTDWERGKVSKTPLNFLFLNWPVYFLNDRLQVVLENLDIGNYFFGGHPRERVGIKEGQKFFFFQFILLLFGLSNHELKKYSRFLVAYIFIALLLVFIFKWRNFDQTIFLSVPLILIMALGLKNLFKQKYWNILFIFFASLEIFSYSIFYSKGLLQ